MQAYKPKVTVNEKMSRDHQPDVDLFLFCTGYSFILHPENDWLLSSRSADILDAISLMFVYSTYWLQSKSQTYLKGRVASS